LRISLNLSNYKGYSWNYIESVWAKGYAFDKFGKLHQEKDLCKIFCQTPLENLNEKISALDGLFSVLIFYNDEVVLVCDRTRTFPIFFKIHLGACFIADHAHKLIDNHEVVRFSPTSEKEFLNCGYVSGFDTLFSDIFQVQAGEIVRIKAGRLQRNFYHLFLKTLPQNKLIQNDNLSIDLVFENIINNFYQFSLGKNIFIPLSGGFDSRFIALISALSKMKNVTCFTLGRYNNEEALVAEKIAKKLGLKWEFIEYNKSIIKNFLSDQEFLDFAHFSSNGVSMPFLQDYFAVKQFYNLGIRGNENVFVPGHLGDFIAGSHLTKAGGIMENSSHQQIIQGICRSQYNLITARFHDKEIESKISSLLQYEFFNAQNKFENWNLKERQAKFIINSSSVFNYYGYKQFFPFMNSAFFQYFQEIDDSLRLHKKLYDEYLISKYFNPNHIVLDYNSISPRKSGTFSKAKQVFKKYLPKRLLNFVTQGKGVMHTIYYKEMTAEMSKALKKNKVQPPVPYNNNYNAIICGWYIEELKSRRPHLKFDTSQTMHFELK